ncbi:MAG: imidazole glycerol phosphate synthase subunit HisH [Candidatus Omnitrophica bacterium]|nr:imidazole glycerol phosphate synthase subunit HisH [Candidatus Omnitrophota bacterium]
MIGIIDYGMGNLYSVAKALERLGAKAEFVESPGQIKAAEKLILPGVGAFADAMKELRKRRLMDPIRNVVKDGKPFLGVCLGLQLLFDESEEGGKCEGLGILPGRVVRFSSFGPKGEKRLKIPHMGWNQVSVKNGCSALLDGVGENQYFYFVHSYYVVPEDGSIIMGETEYGVSFTSVVSSGKVHGCQFHPEKSHRFGQIVLKNFLEQS